MANVILGSPNADGAEIEQIAALLEDSDSEMELASVTSTANGADDAHPPSPPPHTAASSTSTVWSTEQEKEHLDVVSSQVDKISTATVTKSTSGSSNESPLSTLNQSVMSPNVPAGSLPGSASAPSKVTTTTNTAHAQKMSGHEHAERHDVPSTRAPHKNPASSFPNTACNGVAHFSVGDTREREDVDPGTAGMTRSEDCVGHSTDVTKGKASQQEDLQAANETNKAAPTVSSDSTPVSLPPEVASVIRQRANRPDGVQQHSPVATPINGLSEAKTSSQENTDPKNVLLGVVLGKAYRQSGEQLSKERMDAIAEKAKSFITSEQCMRVWGMVGQAQKQIAAIRAETDGGTPDVANVGEGWTNGQQQAMISLKPESAPSQPNGNKTTSANIDTISSPSKEVPSAPIAMRNNKIVSTIESFLSGNMSLMLASVLNQQTSDSQSGYSAASKSFALPAPVKHASFLNVDSTLFAAPMVYGKAEASQPSDASSKYKGSTPRQAQPSEPSTANGSGIPIPSQAPPGLSKTNGAGIHLPLDAAFFNEPPPKAAAEKRPAEPTLEEGEYRRESKRRRISRSPSLRGRQFRNHSPGRSRRSQSRSESGRNESGSLPPSRYRSLSRESRQRYSRRDGASPRRRSTDAERRRQSPGRPKASTSALPYRDSQDGSTEYPGRYQSNHPGRRRRHRGSRSPLDGSRYGRYASVRSPSTTTGRRSPSPTYSTRSRVSRRSPSPRGRRPRSPPTPPPPRSRRPEDEASGRSRGLSIGSSVSERASRPPSERHHVGHPKSFQRPSHSRPPSPTSRSSRNPGRGGSMGAVEGATDVHPSSELRPDYGHYSDNPRSRGGEASSSKNEDALPHDHEQDRLQSTTHPVPGLWFAKVGLKHADILRTDLDVDPEMATALHIPPR